MCDTAKSEAVPHMQMQRKERARMQQQTSSTPSSVVVAGYVRRSSEMQKDNYSIDAQKRAIKDGCRIRSLPEPIFYEDDERSARGEQIAKRPAFKNRRGKECGGAEPR
jgi:hypothetical protein